MADNLNAQYTLFWSITMLLLGMILNTQKKSKQSPRTACIRGHFQTSDAITELELEELSKEGKIKEISVHDTNDGLYVTALLSDRRKLFLGTRREKGSPRMFRDYHRLMRLLDDLSIGRQMIKVLIES